MKIPSEKLISSLVGLGVPALVLIAAISTGGLAGGAAIVAALAVLGGPFGMLGGLAVLGLTVLISKALAKHGFEAVFKAVLRGLREKGLSKKEILKKTEGYPISNDLKSKLREFVNALYGEEAEPIIETHPTANSITIIPAIKVTPFALAVSLLSIAMVGVILAVVYL